MNSAFLAEFLGFYILVVSAVFLLKYESFAEYAREFAEDSSLRYTVAFIELAGGLAIVLTHNVWKLGYRGVVTVIGWMMLVEAVFHFVASDEQESRVVEALDSEFYFLGFGILSVLLGVYLITHGFGM
ncbi:MAG: hypothetical protein ABEJ98_01275 [Candidatus Nanohaloarchaea archaeon]